MESESRLCVVCCGQTELRGRVAMAVHEALSQRIVVRYQLPPLSREETAHYLSHLLRRAGTELPLFEPAAVEAIFQATGGLAPRINRLAHHTLPPPAVAKAKAAPAAHVAIAAAEVPPSPPPPPPPPPTSTPP